MAAPILAVDTGLVFERSLRDASFVQTLEPRIFYAYIPERSQDELPLFDTGRPDFNFVQMFRANRFLGADRLGDTKQISVGLTSGYSVMGRRESEMAPMMTVRMAITIATMGRRIKKSAMALVGLLAGGVARMA